MSNQPTMIDIVNIEAKRTLDDYAQFAHLSEHVARLIEEASWLVPKLKGRKVWMINSTAQGGGVAEMLPCMVQTMRELGVDCSWAVIRSDRASFFDMTKNLHNLIHGFGRPALSDDDVKLYEDVNARCAAAFADRVNPGDVLVVHDPQPAAMGAALKRLRRVSLLWRCHIGLDERNANTSVAWRFLKPYLEPCDRAVFSAPEYIPDYLAGRSSVIYPAIDPLSKKNRELSVHKLVGILCNANLSLERHPVLTPPFAAPALRLQEDGSFRPALSSDDVGLLYRPVVLQISRWDRLKGFLPLLHAFRRLKESRTGRSERNTRRIEILRLVLAGPDPTSIQDDPEGSEALQELTSAYRHLPPALREDIAIFALPMSSRKHNALMVNALQRCATIVVQNSLREGFGLTATEAMWKRKAVLTSRACGLRHQIHDGVNGRSVPDAEDVPYLAQILDEMLAAPQQRDVWGRSAQRCVQQHFLVFQQVATWLRVLTEVAAQPPASSPFLRP